MTKQIAYRFSDYPVIVERKKYDEVLEDIIKGLSSIPSVKQIYQFGSVGAPGISDIDLLIILPDSISKKDVQLLKQEHYNLLNNYRYFIGCHHPYFASESLLTDYFLVRPFSNLNLLYGEGVRFPEIQLSEKDWLALIWELCLNYYPSIFQYYLLKRQIKIRFSIQVANAMRFIIDLLPQIGIDPRSGFQDFCKSVEELRQNWASLSKQQLEQSVLDIFAEGSRLSYQIIFLLKERLLAAGLKFLVKKESGFFSLTGIPKVFKHFNSYTDAMNATEKIFCTFRFVCSFYPEEIGVIYLICQREESVFKRDAAKNLVVKKSKKFYIPQNLKDAIKKRIKAEERIYLFYERNHLPFNLLYNFWWTTYPERKGISSIKESLRKFVFKVLLRQIC